MPNPFTYLISSVGWIVLTALLLELPSLIQYNNTPEIYCTSLGGLNIVIDVLKPTCFT